MNKSEKLPENLAKCAPKCNCHRCDTPQIREEAINILISGCRMAQENGVFELEDARTIMNAIDFLNSDK